MNAGGVTASTTDGCTAHAPDATSATSPRDAATAARKSASAPTGYPTPNWALYGMRLRPCLANVSVGAVSTPVLSNPSAPNAASVDFHHSTARAKHTWWTSSGAGSGNGAVLTRSQ